MTNSPVVRFNFENRNVEVSEPSLGISHVVAMTTKGEPFKPDRVIKNINEFRELYGKEVTSSGGVSNIEAALKGGSMLRISRVLGEGYSKGEVKLGRDVEGSVMPTAVPVSPPLDMMIYKIIGIGHEDDIVPEDLKKVYFRLQNREYGEISLDGSDNLLFSIKFKVQKVGTSVEVYLDLYRGTTIANFNNKTLIYSGLVFRLVSGILDVNSLRDFINNNPYFILDFITDTNTPTSIHNLEQAISYLMGRSDLQALEDTGELVDFSGGSTPYIYYSLPITGDDGDPVDGVAWYDGYEALKDYVDGYQLILSNINETPGMSSQDILSVYKSIAEDLDNIDETVLYIDVPSYNGDGTIKDNVDIVDWVNNAITTIGNSKHVAYFAGGWKYVNEMGSFKDTETVGGVLALGDKSASSYGPWYHFSGQNRGLNTNARGIIIPNYGSPSRYDELNLLANNRVNVTAIKNIPSYGMQPVLLHNFTSSLRTDSYRFLGVVRLCLYIKKNLRPRFEAFLEEPNTFSTWKRMYFKAMEVFEELLEKDAITDLNYQGDQDATSYEDLQINKESDVRQGKYKVVIAFKEVVALQEISVELILDALSGNVSVNFS